MYGSVWSVEFWLPGLVEVESIGVFEVFLALRCHEPQPNHDPESHNSELKPKEFELKVVSVGRDDHVLAVGVIGCASCNRNPHITELRLKFGVLKLRGFQGVQSLISCRVKGLRV